MRVVALIWLTLYTQAAPVDMKPIREMFTRAVESKAETAKLMDELEKAPKTPVITGYIGATTILQAKHAFNPLSKLSYFRTGRNLLESAIARDPAEPELRFLRYAIQVNLPRILGYTSDKQQDRAFLETQLKEKRIKDQHLRAGIVSYLSKHH